MSTHTSPSADSLLKSWMHDRIASIFAASQVEEEDLRALFHNTFTENANIRYNHELVSQETFLKHLEAASTACTHATLSYSDLAFVEIPSGGDSEGGIIAGSFEVTRSLKFRIRAGPAQRHSFNSYSAKVEDLGTEGQDNQRKLRISEFFITSVVKAVPVHVQGIPAPVEPVNPSS